MSTKHLNESRRASAKAKKVSPFKRLFQPVIKGAMAMVLAVGMAPTVALAADGAGGTGGDGGAAGATGAGIITQGKSLNEVVDDFGAKVKDVDGSSWSLHNLLTLESGTYYLEADLSLIAANTQIVPSGLRVAPNATVRIELNGHTLKVAGHAGPDGLAGKNGTNGKVYHGTGRSFDPIDGTAGEGMKFEKGYSRPGIELLSGSTLIFGGEGKVTAIGGNGSNGGNGGNGGNGDAEPHSFFWLGDDTAHGGGGGAGGAGYGASAGIGTSGSTPRADRNMPDQAAAAGKLIVEENAKGSIALDLQGGKAGSLGTPGQGGEDKFAKDYTGKCWAGGGGPGGAGAGGGAAPGYGSGGQAGQAGQNGQPGNEDSDEKGSKKGGKEMDPVNGEQGQMGVPGKIEYRVKSYTVEYYYMVNGKYSSVPDKSVVRLAEKVGDTVSVTDADKKSERDHFVFDDVDSSKSNILSTTVKGDGTDKLKLYFIETFDITLDHSAHGSFEGDQQKYEYKGIRYGSDFPEPPGCNGDAGYTFTKWSPVLPEKVEHSACYTAQFAPNTGTPYKVEFYLQEEDGKTYPETPTVTDSRTGTTDTIASLTEVDKESGGKYYIFDKSAEKNIVSANINGDGSTVLKAYFKDREANTRVIMYAPGERGTFEPQISTCLMGDDTPEFVGEPTGQDGYEFAGWSPEPVETVADSVVYVAQWNAKEVSYKVQTYYQEQGKYEDPAEKERKAHVGETVSLTKGDLTPAIEGYALDGAKCVSSAVIKANEPAVLKVYFKQQFSVTFKPGEHGTFAEQTVGGLDYGAAFPVVPDAAFPGAHEPGYNFDGWDPSEMPKTVTENATYTAQWKAGKSFYSVEYYYRVKGKYLEDPFTVWSFEGTTGEEATLSDWDKDPGVSYYEFDDRPEAGNVDSAVIAGDGSAVLKSHFIEKYSVTYAPGLHGAFAAESSDGSRYGDKTPKFAGAKDAKGNPKAEEGYKFVGWEPKVSDVVSQNALYVAKWKGLPTTYKVYYIDGKTGDELAPAKTVSTHCTGDSVTEKAISISGYRVDGSASQTITLDAKGSYVVFRYALPTVVKGKTYTVSGFSVKVTKVATASAAGTVTITKAKNAKTVTVPASVKLVDGKTYKVTGIAKSAFKKSKKLAKLTIGANVKSIGKGTFKYCKKLSKLTIGANVKSIGKGTFRYCKKLKSVTVKSGKLTKSAVKGMVYKSKIKTIKLKGSAAKKMKKKYQKYAGKKIVVKKIR